MEKMRVRILIYVCVFVLIAYGILTGSQARLPIQSANGIEKKFPIYPESIVAATMQLDFPEGAQMVLESKEAPEQILSFYKREMENKGWTLRLEREDFVALFKDNRGLMIQTEGRLEGKTKVTLVLGELDA
jgi:hypothetical protein